MTLVRLGFTSRPNMCHKGAERRPLHGLVCRATRHALDGTSRPKARATCCSTCAAVWAHAEVLGQAAWGAPRMCRHSKSRLDCKCPASACSPRFGVATNEVKKGYAVRYVVILPSWRICRKVWKTQNGTLVYYHMWSDVRLQPILFVQPLPRRLEIWW